MRKQQWITAGVVLSIMGCGVASNARQAPSGSSTSDSPQVKAIQKLLTKGRAIDATTYRVKGNANSPNLRTQVQAKMLANRGKTPRPKADWNVVTGTPVRTVPGVYGASFSTFSNTDQVAFAVDDFNSTSSTPGIISGVSGTLPAAATNSSTLFVLNNLYNGNGAGGPGSAPQLAYYNNATTKFGLGSIIYSFNPNSLQLFAIDRSGTSHCFKVTPPTAARHADRSQRTSLSTAGNVAEVSAKAGPRPATRRAGVSVTSVFAVCHLRQQHWRYPSHLLHRRRRQPELCRRHPVHLRGGPAQYFALPPCRAWEAPRQGRAEPL